MKKETMLTVLLVVLVAVSVVQAFQLVGLSGAMSSGSVTKAPAPASTESSSPNVPSSLQNLPQMVGGC